MTQRTPGETYDPAASTYSATIQVPATSTAVMPVVNAQRLSNVPGLATVSINVDVPSPILTTSRNRKLIARLRYGTGKGEGAADIDVSSGAQFTCPGTSAIHVAVQQQRVDSAGAFAGDGWNVSAIVHWGTSINPSPAYMTSDAFTFPAAAGVLQPIPARAARGILLVDPAAEIATLTVRYFQDSVAGSRSIGAITAPTPATWLPVVAGARFFDLVYTGAGTPRVIATWELWL